MASTVYVNCEDFPEDGRQMESNPKLPGAKRKSESEKSSRASEISRKWSAEEINDLIDEFEKHPCLWDVFNREYHDKTRRQQALKEIEDEIGIRAEEIRNKIASLRTQLGREIAKVKAKISGQTTSDNYKPVWLHWEKLQFLIPVMQAGKSKDNLHVDTCVAARDSLSPAPSDELCELDTVSISSTASDSSLVTPQRGSAKQSSKKSLGTKKEEFLTTCIQVLQEPIQPKAETQPQCPFALYMAQKPSGLDRRSRAIAEKRISDIIFDLELNSQSLNAQPTYQVDQERASAIYDTPTKWSRSLRRAEAVAVY